MNAIRILKHNVPGWKPLEWRTITTERLLGCPIHGGWSTLVSILGDPGDRLDVVCCPVCGLVSYDRVPTRQWLADYYRSTWMDQTLEQAIDIARAEVDCGVTITEEHRTPLRILDIGCGYGTIASHLVKAGHHVEAVEACAVRAEAVRKVIGIEVHEGDFTDIDFGDRKYDMIVHSHVLEHVADPIAFVSQCASLQDVGGHMQIRLPNFFAEPSFGVVLFYLHVMSYTASAMEHLLHLCGYRSGIKVDADLYVNGWREDVQQAPAPCDISRHVGKLLRGLGFQERHEHAITWQRHIDGAAVLPVEHTQLGEHRVDRTMIVQTVTDRRTDSPIEIQWDGPLQVFVK